VLPFQNLSGDAEQEFFADGMAEEIITALSHYRWFFVIARNSSFTYKGRAVDVTQVARELGVRYVLEGSVRKAGNRVRVTAQLIDATTGNHIWAERYDRELDDIFALQDEITETIVAAVEPELGSVERERARRKPPESLDAWDLYQRGLWHLFDDVKRDSLAEAKQLFQRACELDPGFAAAHAELAYTHVAEIIRGLSDDLKAR
jgi:adenylate cyclase